MRAAGHKLLAKFDGVPLVRKSVITALACASQSVIVVTGYMGTDIRDAIEELEVEIVHNDAYKSGMASSLITGTRMVQKYDSDGVMVMLADMPALTSVHLNCLIEEFRRVQGQAVIRAVCHGKPGNPVIFPREFYSRLLELRGDAGARNLILRGGTTVIDVEIGDAARLDVDTPEQVRLAGGQVDNATSRTFRHD